MRHLVAVLLVAVTTTGCIKSQNKPVAYIASGTLVALGTIGVVTEPAPCNEPDVGDNISCGISQGMGELMAYTALGLGVVGLAITALSKSEPEHKAVR